MLKTAAVVLAAIVAMLAFTVPSAGPAALATSGATTSDYVSPSPTGPTSPPATWPTSPGPCCSVPEPRPNPRVLVVMPMGDSITEGVGSTASGGYRGPLATLLPPATRYVGHLTDPAGRRHEGHSGWTIDQLAVDARAWARMTVSRSGPGVVLLDAGTNDVGNGNNHTGAQMLASMDHLLDELLAGGAGHIVVAQLTITTYNNAAQQAEQRAYNAGLPALAAAKSGKVSVVDMAAAPLITLADGVHPDDAGYAEMARRWHAALRALGLAP